MLNTFPSLLTFSFFAPMLLRITVAVTFAYLVHKQFKHREAIAEVRVPLIGKMGGLVWVGLLIESGMALAMLVGWHVQIAALLGLVLCFKHFIYAKKYPSLVPLHRSTYIFIFIICLTLLITGAGALAMDLPL